MNLISHYTDTLIEAGCDEAGRGCLAGPVVAAAVILDRDKDYPMLDDSKKLTEKQRKKLRDVIMQEALAYGIGIVDNKEIDEINILNASFLAMHRAIEQLKIKPEFLLIDGNRFNPYKDIKHLLGECLKLFSRHVRTPYLEYRGLYFQYNLDTFDTVLQSWGRMPIYWYVPNLQYGLNVSDMLPR